MRAADEDGRSTAMSAELTSPYLDSELFRDDTEPVTRARLAALREESAFQQEIRGANDMDGVADPLAVPFRWICRLDIDYDITPFGSDRHLTITGRGTGTLISPCHVLTAAHNLIEYDAVRKNTVRATRIRVTPAHDGSSSPSVATVEADLARRCTLGGTSPDGTTPPVAPTTPARWKPTATTTRC
jgi:hypothetical protein